LVELGQLGLNVVLDVFLLVPDDLKNFIFEFGVSLHRQLIEFIKH
jgi:hypothetical protein